MQKKTLVTAALIVLAVASVSAWLINRQNDKTAKETLLQSINRQEEEKETAPRQSPMPGNYSGAILAGSMAPLLDFRKADYEKAVATDKLIVLYFYANWCPICRYEFPKMENVFNGLNTDKIVGFRVNYNDGETDGDETELARQFGVAYQHTKVFVKNGQRILKAPDSWDETRYLQEINKALEQ